ncbi:uncharacterized protein LOC112093419 [Morus notabilis]|uniref:uncharacterized protein LOC112093419 n=1 Tax=Morus notabilis TaxID=981085 RepID=UPI000CED0385|nr:uncharacterized protein LOC112093419 [Morus notabilis]
MEVYVDNMLVKNRKIENHVEDLKRMFDVLRMYRMKLNPHKCAFGVGSGKCLGFMVSSQGIEANPALLDMRSPRKPMEVQKLIGLDEGDEQAFQQLKAPWEATSAIQAGGRGNVEPVSDGLRTRQLSQFDIDYKPRTAIKGQALADFVAEFTGLPEEVELDDVPLRWKLYVDGSSNENGSGARLVLQTPEGHKITSTIRFEFPASNNEAEYETLLAGLLLAEHLKVGNIDIFSDSQLVLNQVKDQYETQDEKMAAYLKKVKEALEKFMAYDIQQVPRTENSNADALTRLATSKDTELLKLVPVEVLKASTTEGKPEVMLVNFQPSWMDPIIRYMVDDELPKDRQLAKRTRYQASRYTMHDDILYRRGYSTPLLRCLGEEEVKNVLSEVHSRICGNHAMRQSLAYKILW